MTAVLLTLNSCSESNSEDDDENEDFDGVMTSGTEMSNDMEIMMNKDEFQIAADMDNHPLPFETPAYLKLKSYSLINLKSETKLETPFNFLANCGTWEWDFVNLKFSRTNILPVDSIKMMFPSRGSTINNRRFLWWKCTPLVLDKNNLPTELIMRFEWINNSNKQLNFIWTASYQEVVFNDSSRVFPKTVDGEITCGNNNHGDYYVKLNGGSDFSGETPLINFQWLIYKGSSKRLSANLDISFTKHDDQLKFRPVYNLVLNNKHETKLNKHTEFNFTFDASKVWIANATVADMDSALSGYIMHKDKKVANLIIKGIDPNLSALFFKFKDNAYFKFINGNEKSAVSILNKVIHHKHPFRRFFKYIFHYNNDLTPGYD